jgi:hypothetical protein
VHWSLTRGSRDESVDNVGIGEVSQLVALPREVLDVIPQGFVSFMSAILVVPRITWMRVRVLEISNEIFLGVRPALNTSELQVFYPRSRRICQV